MTCCGELMSFYPATAAEPENDYPATPDTHYCHQCGRTIEGQTIDEKRAEAKEANDERERMMR